MATSQSGEVVLEAQPDLEYIGILEEADEGLSETYEVETKEIALLLSRYLQEGDLVAYTSLEAWSGLRVDPDDHRLADLSYGLARIELGVYDVYGHGALGYG